MATTVRRRTWELLEGHKAGDRLALIVDGVLIALIVISALSVVLESVDALFERYRFAFTAIEVGAIAIFTVEYALRLWSIPDSDDPAFAGVMGRLRYARSFLSVIDVIAIAPFYLALLLPYDFGFLRIVRLLRLLKLAHYFPAVSLLVRVFQAEYRALLSILGTLLMVLVLVSSGIHYFEREAQPEAFGSIPASMWWAVATLTTVGYGDVTPVTVGGRIFAACVTIIGIGIVALPAGLLASRFSEELANRHRQFGHRAREVAAAGTQGESDRQRLAELGHELGLDDDDMSRIADTAADVSEGAVCPHCGKPLVRSG